MSEPNTLRTHAEARELACALLDISAVQLSPERPFRWASGIEAPVYCDNRLLLGYPALREEVVRLMERRIHQRGWQPQRIAGTATAGIPHATLLADHLDLPLLYVRSQPKAHGKGQQIEGPLEAGERVVIVEDLISTGGSLFRVAEALREAGAYVEGALAIFSYDIPGVRERFEKAEIPLEVLTNLDVLLETAVEEGKLLSEMATYVRTWRDKRKVTS